MSRRIIIRYRGVMTVGIKVQAQRIVRVPGVGIFLKEPCCQRVIHPRIDVIEPGLHVILVSGVADAVVHVSRAFDDISKGIVAVGGCNISCICYKGGYVSVAVVDIAVGRSAVPVSDCAEQQVCAVYVPSCLVAGTVEFKKKLRCTMKKNCLPDLSKTVLLYFSGNRDQVLFFLAYSLFFFIITFYQM